MKLIFLGVQGSGKGTQGKIISRRLNITHISTGDLLRSSEGKLRKVIDSYISKGNLVPDDLILKLLKKRLKKEDCKNGFILDGFPRTMEQARDLDKVAKIDKVIEIFISDEEAIRRVSARWNCEKCGIAYNIITEPKPKQKDKCDKCGSTLSQREDDKPESIKKRLQIYHKEIKPMLEHYDHIKIDGEQSIEKVAEDILKELKQI